MPQKTTTKTSKSPKKLNYTYAVGRRKTATARVRLFSKAGDSLVNGKPVAEYFPGIVFNRRLIKPFSVTQTKDKFSFSAKVAGSGIEAQLEAVIHGLSRALSVLDKESYRSLLKKAGLLTRDSRMKESRKVGTGGKARRKKQSPKR